MIKGIVLLFVWLLVVPATCFSQVSAVYGSLRVVVEDQSGAMVPSAEITVRMAERNWVRKVSSTGEAGYFPALAPGDHTVAVSAEGFEPQQAEATVLLGHEGALRFVLQPGTRRERITVVAQSNAVDSYTIPVHTNVSGNEIHALPINQRSFLDFALLDSGLQRDTLRVHAVAVTSGFNVMGQRRENEFTSIGWRGSER